MDTTKIINLAELTNDLIEKTEVELSRRVNEFERRDLLMDIYDATQEIDRSIRVIERYCPIPAKELKHKFTRLKIKAEAARN